MYRHHASSIQVAAGLDRLFRVQVMGAHHGLGFIGADRNHGQVEGTQRRPNLDESRKITGVAGEVEAPIGRDQNPRRPECASCVSQPALTPVLRGNADDPDAGDRARLAPVELIHGHDTVVAQQATVAEGHQESSLRRTPSEAFDGGQIEMVVVVVRDGDDVDRWQGIECDPGFDITPRTEPAQGARRLRPDRVGENRETADLNQERRVSHPGHCRDTMTGVFPQERAVVRHRLRGSLPADHRAPDASELKREDDPKARAFEGPGSVLESPVRVARRRAQPRLAGGADG